MLYEVNEHGIKGQDIIFRSIKNIPCQRSINFEELESLLCFVSEFNINAIVESN